MLREQGFPVIEADRISHRLMEKDGAAYAAVVGLLGESILDSDKSISRSQVAAIVFNDRDKLRQLNAIIHPKVEQALAQEFVELETAGASPMAFVEAALVFEAGMHKKLDGVVVAWSLPEQQLARLMERGMSEAEARKRMAAQMPVSEKMALATEKIDCSGSREETRRQVTELAGRLRQRAAAK